MPRRGGLLGKLRDKLGGSERADRAPAPPPHPITTQSSPGQIANLQERYGGGMAPARGSERDDG